MLINIVEIAAYEDIYCKITSVPTGDEKDLLWDIFIWHLYNSYHTWFSINLRFFGPTRTDIYTSYTCCFYNDWLCYMGRHKSNIQKRCGEKSNRYTSFVFFEFTHAVHRINHAPDNHLDVGCCQLEFQKQSDNLKLERLNLIQSDRQRSVLV